MDLPTLDEAGRVVIPRSNCDELHLEPQLEGKSDSLTLLSPSLLKKKQGIWVFNSAGEVSAASTDKIQEHLRQNGMTVFDR